MTFEDEVQALVSKYGLVDVEITYKKKVVLSATQTFKAPYANISTVSQTQTAEDEIIARYTSGPIGNITT